MLDTARASDSYSNSSLKTLNYIGRNGIKYDNAMAPGTWTATSHASLFSGKPVSAIPEASKDMFKNGTHTIDPWFVKTKFLSDNQKTTASELSALGYSTTLMSNNPFVNSFTNIANGFNKCYDLWATTNISNSNAFTKKIVSILDKGSSARMKMMDVSYAVSRLMPSSIVDKVYLNLRIRMDRGVANADSTYALDRGARHTNSILKQHVQKNTGFDILPEFMFINYMEAHENYPVPDHDMIQDKWMYLSGITELDEHTLKTLHTGYLKRLKYLDTKVGDAINTLKGLGKLDNAVVIITSDHGQFFGEHGLLYHSQYPFSGVSHVPTVAAVFKNGKILKDRKIIEEPVSLTQMHNSILSIASGKSNHINLKTKKVVFTEHTGISEGWDEYLLRKLKERSNYARMIYNAKKSHNHKSVSIHDNKFSLVHFYSGRKDELYDITDTEEKENLIDSKRAYANDLLRKYKKTTN